MTSAGTSQSSTVTHTYASTSDTSTRSKSLPGQALIEPLVQNKTHISPRFRSTWHKPNETGEDRWTARLSVCHWPPAIQNCGRQRIQAMQQCRQPFLYSSIKEDCNTYQREAASLKEHRSLLNHRLLDIKCYKLIYGSDILRCAERYIILQVEMVSWSFL